MNFINERNLRNNIKEGNSVYLPKFELDDGFYKMTYPTKVETLKDLRKYKEEYSAIYAEIKSLYAQKISTIYRNAISKLIYIEDENGNRTMNGSKTISGEKSGTTFDFIAENSNQRKFDSVALILNGLDSQLNQNLDSIRFKPFNVKELLYGKQPESSGMFKSPVILPEFTDNGIAVNFRNGRNSNAIEIKYRTYTPSEAESIYNELVAQLDNFPQEKRAQVSGRLNELFSYAKDAYSVVGTSYPGLVENSFNANCRKILALSTMLFYPDLPLKRAAEIVEPNIDDDAAVAEYDSSLLDQSIEQDDVSADTSIVHSVDFYGLVDMSQDFENGNIINSIRPKNGKVFVVNSVADGQLKINIKDNLLIDENAKQ